MAQALPHRGETPEAVSRQLKSLRRRIAVWLLVDGACYVLPPLLVLAAVDFLLDYGLNANWGYQMDLSQRTILLVMAAAGLIALFVWRMILPLTKPLADEALILEVERKHRELGQSLISAVQFSRLREALSPGVSTAMVDATIDLGLRRAKSVRFGDVLNLPRFYRSLAIVAASVGLLTLGGVGVALNPTLRTWFNRNVLLADESWPQDVYFEIVGAEDGVLTIVRGDDHVQRVAIRPESRRTPEAVTMEFRPYGLRPDQKMNREKEGDAFQLEFRNVLEEFEFRVYSDRAVSQWTRVKLLPPPQVDELVLEVTPPAYTGESTQRLPPGKGPYSVLRGSSLRIAGWASKELSSAELILEGGTLPMKIEGTKRFSIELSPDQLTAGKYILDLTDTEGLINRRPPSFGMRIRADNAPRINASLIGIGGMVVPRAILPIRYRITDDYVVTDVYAEYNWRSDADAKTDHVPFSSVAELLERKPPRLEDIEVLQLEPLAIPTGATLVFKVAAADNDDISGPNIGYSTEFLVRVVTEDELRADLLRREKERRQEFEALLNNQEDLITDTRALEAGLRGSEEIGPDQKQTLMQLQRRQKRVATNTENIAKQLFEVIAEVQNNRLEEEGGPLQQRLYEQIIEPMVEIHQQAVPEAVRRLDRTRRLADEAQQRDTALADAIRQQEIVAAAMREILLHMVKTEGYQEAVNLLYEIEKSQKGVFDLTEQEMRERIKRLLEQGGNAPTQPEKPEEKESNDDK
ncbi:MAG: hypothetical protein RIC55_16250 [Pirellulaceae bacterium]